MHFESSSRRLGAILFCFIGALLGWSSTAVAQLPPEIAEIDARFAKQEAEAREDMVAGNDAIGSLIAYRDKKWTEAYRRGTAACQGDKPVGCEVVGWLLAEGHLGAADPRGAEMWHRKAAALFSARCRARFASNSDCLEAGEFFSSNAVPAVRDPALGRKFFATASKGYIESCEQRGDDCFYAGYLANGEFTGRADPAAAARFWRRGCDIERQSDGFAGINCDELTKLLAYGPAGVKNEAEARRQIETGKCSAAAPVQGQSYRVDKLYCAIVAEYLFDGIGGKKDAVLAERLMRYSCEFGEEFGCTSLEARGLKRDDYKGALALRDIGLTTAARDRFETLCTANNARACNEAGRIYHRDANDAEKKNTLRYYARACALGETLGCANQGSVLRNLGGQSNLVAARAALRKACDAKDAISCGVLGHMMADGDGGTKDPAGAIPLLEFACAGNHASGCFVLARSYTNGDGVAADQVLGRKNYEKACELGSNSGCNNFASALENGRGGPTDPVRARALYETACGKGVGAACNSIGRFKRDGLGGPADPVAAREHFKQACNNRIASACNAYSDSLLSSAGGPTDRASAITYRRYSCVVLDNQEACTWLSDGGHRDPVAEGFLMAANGRVAQALPLFRQACNANNGEGCRGLGQFTPEDKITDSARNDLFRKACSLGSKDACDYLQFLANSGKL